MSIGNNTTGLQRILQAINELPEGGVSVQRTTGTVTTGSDGIGGVDCGFQPDFVVIHVGIIDDCENNLVLNFAENHTESSVFTVACRDTQYAFIQANATCYPTGFGVYVGAYDWSFGFHNVERTFSYTAVKYT